MLIILGILIIVCGIIGISYAVWRLTISQTGINKIATSCLKLELTKEENVINLQNAYPIYDEEGKTLTPYSFTITNTCDMFASFIVQLEMTSSSTLPSKYVRVMINNEAIQNLNEYEESTEYVSRDTTEARILARGSLGNGDSEDYTLRLWIDSDVDQFTTDAIGKTLRAKITITASPSTYSPVENGITTLHDAILANEYQTTDIQTAIDKINSKQQPDFTKTAPIIEWQETQAKINQTGSYYMPDPADVGSGKDYASHLTETNVYVGLAKNYKFDQETGKYTLSDFIYQDPTTIDFSNQDYYICNAGTRVHTSSTSDSYLEAYNETVCTIMYKVSSFLNSSIATVSSNYPGVKYNFQLETKYTQTEVESDKSDKGLYAMEDDYGTSYYYRGSVKNNYVYFAGFYWRILRINGDGSIRLLYVGTTPIISGTNGRIGTSGFNTVRDLPMYVGYMYGDSSGRTLEEVNANINDSTIKSYLDSWYSSNLSKYSNYIADSGFCNDRSFYSGDGLNNNHTTNYESEHRKNTYSPILTCPNIQNDLFTVSNLKGNQALDYPIGLITLDELLLAGVQSSRLNNLSYVNAGAVYWTMSPGSFSQNYTSAINFAMGDGMIYSQTVHNNIGVRPVINLNANVEITGGIGTQNEPFVVKTT